MFYLELLREIFFGSFWSALIWVPAFSVLGLTFMVEEHRRRERAKAPAGGGAVQPYNWQVHGL